MRAKNIEFAASTLSSLVQMIVDQPERVEVTFVEGQDETRLLCSVSPDDLGKVIGKDGKTVRCLRTLLIAASRTSGHRYFLDVVTY